MVLMFPLGVPFGGSTNPIVPGGYAVVGAAAFAGAVTHTVSVSVIVFELTGQMTHIIPVIISVLIANAISQTLDLSIYDSIVQIKKLPFIPPILNTSSLAHNIFVEDIMVREMVYIWRNCTYRDIKRVLNNNKQLQSFPLVDNGVNMILLGSVQREELNQLAINQLSRERRLQEVRRRYSIQDALSQIDNISETTTPSSTRKLSRRFEVIPVQTHEPKSVSPKSTLKSPKSILKQTISFTYSPNATVTNLHAQDSRLRQAFENIFHKSLKLQDANPEKAKQQVEKSPQSYHRRVQLV